MSYHTISLSTSGTVVVAAQSVLGPSFNLTGTLSGDVTLDFGQGEAVYFVSTKSLALGGHVLTFGSGSGTATPIAIGNLYTVLTSAPNIVVASTVASSFAAGGDLSGSSSSQEVIGLLTKALPALGSGYLNYTGAAWSLDALPAGITLTKDLGGTLALPEVVGLLNHALPSIAAGYLNWTGSAWALSSVSGPSNTVPSGLTGATSFTAHGVLVGNGTSAISSVSPVSSDGLPLIGSSTATPAFGAISLASTAVTNVLAHGNGGTDVSAPGTSGNVLTSNGTSWTSTAPAGIGGAAAYADATGVSLPDSGSPVTAVASVTITVPAGGKLAIQANFDVTAGSGDFGENFTVGIGFASSLFTVSREVTTAGRTGVDCRGACTVSYLSATTGSVTVYALGQANFGVGGTANVTLLCWIVQ